MNGAAEDFAVARERMVARLRAQGLAGELVLGAMADGNDQAAIRRQLLQQVFGDALRGRGCENTVEGAALFPAHAAVGVVHVHVAQLELAQPLPGLLLQRPDALHAVDLAHQLGQDRRLVAGARADFQHPLAGARSQQ